MQTFSIAPAAARVPWILLLALIPVAVAIGFVLVSTLGSTRTRFEVSPAGLRLRGDLYGRMIPAAELKPGDARRVDLQTTTHLQPARRTFGTGLPGYQAGWFRLRSGERALVYLTDRTRAVYVPTTAGYAVLVSPDDPDGFVRAVAALAPPR